MTSFDDDSTRSSSVSQEVDAALHILETNGISQAWLTQIHIRSRVLERTCTFKTPQSTQARHRSQTPTCTHKHYTQRATHKHTLSRFSSSLREDRIGSVMSDARDHPLENIASFLSHVLPCCLPDTKCVPESHTDRLYDRGASLCRSEQKPILNWPMLLKP